MSIEAMKQALEALMELNEVSKGPSAICLPAEIDTAMDALQQAIEQAEKQEPVAWADMEVRGEDKGLSWTPGYFHAQPLYTAPREWVGLTDDEIKEIVGPWGPTPTKGYTRKLFDQIEAKLRERNT